MAVDKLVDSSQLDSDLTSVANAIRTKGGTSAQLAFPAGFVSAIGDIPSGSSLDYDKLFDGTFPFGDVVLDSATELYPSGVNVLFQAQNGLTKISSSTVTNISKAYMFCNCINLTEAIFPNLLTDNSYSLFHGCEKIKKVVMPKLTIVGTDVLRRARALEVADLGVITSIPARAFYQLSATQNSDIILRSTTLATMTNSNCIDIPTGGKLHFYVPSALINDYKTATNWVTHFDSGKIDFQALEGSDYESTDWWRS